MQLRADTTLDAAVEAAMAGVRKAPGDAGLRTQLFQLFCLRGDWERALAQLGAAGRLDAGAADMARAYREVIRCEVLRGQVFAGERTPLLLGAPTPWIAQLVDALRHDAAGHAAAATAAREAALELAPATTGEVDGDAFAWLADADSRIGPVQEAIVNGKYYWIGFEQLREIAVEAPADLRDLVWIPACLTFVNGGRQVAFLPSRYPLRAGADDALRMARRTEWRPLGGDGYAGAGQRMIATDAADYALLEVRKIEFDSTEGVDG